MKRREAREILDHRKNIKRFFNCKNFVNELDLGFMGLFLGTMVHRKTAWRRWQLEGAVQGDRSVGRSRLCGRSWWNSDGRRTWRSVVSPMKPISMVEESYGENTVKVEVVGSEGGGATRQ